MPSEAVKLKLDGVVSLRNFHTATQALLNLLEEFTIEASEDGDIEWVVSDLDYGSAMIACTGHVRHDDAITARDQVVSAYLGLAVDMAEDRLEDYPKSIQNSARMLSSVVNGFIPRLVMSAGDADEDAQVVSHSLVAKTVADAKDIQSFQIRKFLHTTIKGEVVLVSKSNQHYFTLRQSYTGLNFRCYVKQSLWETAYKCLGMKGQIVLVDCLLNVEGRVASQIAEIAVLPQSEPGGWREAIGSAIPPKDSITTHNAIRKVRDGEE